MELNSTESIQQLGDLIASPYHDVTSMSSKEKPQLNLSSTILIQFTLKALTKFVCAHMHM
jgi:hypothetical protein